MDKVEYVCIDFETANGHMTSACSVGLVGVKKSRIVFEKYYLINPNEEFLPQNIRVHGIKPDDVLNSPTFDIIYQEMFDLINNTVLVAHNASFDMSVLKALLLKYNLDFPNSKVACTLKLSKIAFKDKVENCRLNTLSSYLEVKHNHHNALSDAYVCYEIIERSKRIYQVYDIYDLYESVNLSFGLLNRQNQKDCKEKLKKEVKSKSLKLDGYIIASTGKPKYFTKNEFKKIISENGGLYSKDISLVINTFVIFNNPTNENLHALNNLKSKKEIKVLSEKEFMELIHG